MRRRDYNTKRLGPLLVIFIVLWFLASSVNPKSLSNYNLRIRLFLQKWLQSPTQLHAIGFYFYNSSSNQFGEK